MHSGSENVGSFPKLSLGACIHSLTFIQSCNQKDCGPGAGREYIWNYFRLADRVLSGYLRRSVDCEMDIGC